MKALFSFCTATAAALTLVGCVATVLSESEEPAKSLPVVVSSSQCDIDSNWQMETVEIVLVDGRRYHDTVVGPEMGEKWEGWFRICVRDCSGDIVSDQSLNHLMRSGRYPAHELWFRTPEFGLVFDDYNGDGQVDFNLGEYACSNYWLYRLFTIGPDGVVRRLSIGSPENALPVDVPTVSTDMITVRGNGLIQNRYYTPN